MTAASAKSFHIVNLGCKVNRVEADTIGATLLARGLCATDEADADFIIVNTCTVTAEADKKARKAVRHALEANKNASVVVTGCAAIMAPDVFESMGSRVRILGKQDIADTLSEGLHDAKQDSRASDTAASAILRMGDGFRTRVGLKVQDGCDHACAYCIVHVARGPARSVRCSQVLSEARSYFETGVGEIVLAGIDIGAYRDGDTRLPQLAEQLLAEADATCPNGMAPARIRISSIEPLNVDDALIELLASSGGRLCRHLHIPLQSGSERVLKEMNRPYSAEWFAGLVASLRNRVPGIALSTDVIVGFPGETEQDFQDTCELVREAGFMRLHVFPYSRREGTPAAERDDQIPSDVKRKRAKALRDIGVELAKRDLERRAGTTELCIIEGDTALTESYHEVPSPERSPLGALVSYRFPNNDILAL